jgi:hypothetical protein
MWLRCVWPWGLRVKGSENADPSVTTYMTGVSIWVRLRGSQVSKARPRGKPGQAGAPFDFYRRISTEARDDKGEGGIPHGQLTLSFVIPAQPRDLQFSLQVRIEV